MAPPTNGSAAFLDALFSLKGASSVHPCFVVVVVVALVEGVRRRGATARRLIELTPAPTTTVTKGKHVFLTGASAGIGEHWAHVLAKAGATSLALAARRAEKLAALAEAVRKESPACRVVVVACDVGDPKSIVRALDEAEKACGGVTFDVIINNAGVGPDAPVLKASVQSFDEAMNINVRGPLVLSQEASRRLIEKGRTGSIINVASIYGLRVGFNNAVYATSKAAIVQLTKAMAIEVLGKGIRVNAIAPCVCCVCGFSLKVGRDGGTDATRVHW